MFLTLPILNLLDNKDRELYDSRRSVCRDCPLFVKTGSVCSLCGCFINLKILLRDSRCPDNPPRW